MSLNKYPHNGEPPSSSPNDPESIFADEISSITLESTSPYSYIQCLQSTPLPSYESVRRPSGNCTDDSPPSLSQDVSTDLASFALCDRLEHNSGGGNVFRQSASDHGLAGRIIPSTQIGQYFASTSFLESEGPSVAPLQDDSDDFYGTSPLANIGVSFARFDQKKDPLPESVSDGTNNELNQPQRSSPAQLEPNRPDFVKREMKIETTDEFLDCSNLSQLQSPESRQSVLTFETPPPANDQQRLHLPQTMMESNMLAQAFRNFSPSLEPSVVSTSSSQLQKVAKTSTLSLLYGNQRFLNFPERETLDFKDATGAVAALVSPSPLAPLAADLNRSARGGRAAQPSSLGALSAEQVAGMAEGDAALPYSSSKRILPNDDGSPSLSKKSYFQPLAAYSEQSPQLGAYGMSVSQYCSAEQTSPPGNVLTSQPGATAEAQHSAEILPTQYRLSQTPQQQISPEQVSLQQLSPHQIQHLSSPHQIQHQNSPHQIQHLSSPHQIQHQNSPHQIQHLSSPHQIQHLSSPHQIQHLSSPHQIQHQPSPHQIQHLSSPHQIQHLSSPHQIQHQLSPHQIQHQNSPHQIQHQQISPEQIQHQQISPEQYFPQQMLQQQQQLHQPPQQSMNVSQEVTIGSHVRNPRRAQQIAFLGDDNSITLSTDNSNHHQLMWLSQHQQQSADVKVFDPFIVRIENCTSNATKRLKTTRKSLKIHTVDQDNSDLEASYCMSQLGHSSGTSIVGEQLNFGGENHGSVEPTVDAAASLDGERNDSTLPRSTETSPSRVTYEGVSSEAAYALALNSSGFGNRNNNNIVDKIDSYSAPSRLENSQASKEPRGVKRKTSQRKSVRATSMYFLCGICGLECPTRVDLRKHIEKDHKDYTLSLNKDIIIKCKCPVVGCNFSSFSRPEFDGHMKKHLQDGFTPTGKQRSTQTPLQRHRYGKEDIKCPRCAYKCVQQVAFIEHTKLHKMKLPIVNFASCPFCGKDFREETDVRTHMNREHRCTEERDHWKCMSCSFTSVQEKKLIQHLRMHTGEKPHLCSHCPYRAGRRDNLRSHVRRMHHAKNLYADSFQPTVAFLGEEIEAEETENNDTVHENEAIGYREGDQNDELAADGNRNSVSGDAQPMVGLSNNTQDFEIDPTLANLPYHVLDSLSASGSSISAANIDSMIDLIGNSSGGFEHQLMLPTSSSYGMWPSGDHHSVSVAPSSSAGRCHVGPSSMVDAASYGADAHQIPTHQISTLQISTQPISTQHISTQHINTQHISTQQINAQHINAQHINTQQINTHQINTHHINAQNINTQQINLQQMNSQHISTQQLNPQQMSTQQMSTQHMNPQHMNPQQMNSQQMSTQKHS